MSGKSKRTQFVLLLVLALVMAGFLSGGCAKPGTSGLTFYEFFDPT